MNPASKCSLHKQVLNNYLCFDTSQIKRKIYELVFLKGNLQVNLHFYYLIKSKQKIYFLINFIYIVSIIPKVGTGRLKS